MSADAAPATMHAYVVRSAGGPDVLERTTLPVPTATEGRALIRIRAFGLNRAEAVTRAGGSGDAVRFPRVIGIECVGEVIDGGGTDLEPGRTVAAAMGGMGRAYDGSYAEFTSVPRSNVFPLDTTLDWPTLGAIPETFFTATGCLRSVGCDTGTPRVLVRPGASALGLAIAQIVAHLGGETIGVTRSAGKRERLLAGGFTEVLVADGPVADVVRARWPQRADGVVDTIASDESIADDVAAAAPTAQICVAGSLAESYATASSGTVGAALATDRFTFYSSETLDAAVDTSRLQTLVERVEAGDYATNIAEVITFEELVDAHRGMDANAYAGKVVVTFD